NDPVASPGDPIFYLHHTWLDKIFWDWQSEDLPARLEDIGLRNALTVLDPTHPPPQPPILEGDPLMFPILVEEYPSPEVLRPQPDTPPQVPAGDPADVTTLDHIIDMFGIIPNATIADVMDIAGGLLCYEYV
ncbi:tyrosinase family protein, partial [Candidatus Bathyarchaeota archaeon]|nr:tyrosinase family protein [Candidatus Bathyarchaeota archaeon]